LPQQLEERLPCECLFERSYLLDDAPHIPAFPHEALRAAIFVPAISRMSDTSGARLDRRA
jgi:hypothetical protein